MLKALEEQLNTPEAQELGFEEKLGLDLMPMDRRTPQPAYQRTHRRRQKLSRLRPGPQG
ncbi:hypothetical protein DFAR_2550019 [Desulfarculales bacterium]